MNNQLIDQSARDAALDPFRSLVVTAPAGSGKTELLTRRILTLLAHTNEPEEVLAITFTRKAAAEMRERVLQFLRWQTNAKGKLPDASIRPLVDAVLERDKTLGWNLLANPQRLRLQTIDSFTGSLIANLPLQSGFGGRPVVREDALPLYREAVRQCVSLLETDAKVGHALGLLLRHVDNRFSTLENLLVNLLMKRDEWLPLLGVNQCEEEMRPVLEDTLRHLIEHYLHDAAGKLASVESELMSLIDYAKTQLATIDPASSLLNFSDTSALPEIDADALDQWRLIYQFLLTKDGDLRKEKGITKKNGFPTDKKEVSDPVAAKERKQAFAALLQELSQRPDIVESLKLLNVLPAPEFAESQWQIVSALLTVLPRLVAELNLTFRYYGEVDFTEQSLAALHAMTGSESSDLRYKLDQKIRHILVDEFQDTSRVQFDLLKALVAEWRCHADEASESPRTLFVVGDGMQSIYGFRAADVGLFLDARQHGVGDVALDAQELVVNFRSSPVIVNWVNKVFSRLFPAQDDPDLGASHHVHAEAIKTDEGEVVLRGFVDDENDKLQTAYLLETIHQLRAQHPDQTIAVLVRAKNHLQPLIEGLIAQQVPWQATDIAPLVGRPVVQDLLMLLRAIANPADRIAALAVLRSPLCGLTNHDLFLLAAANPENRANEDDSFRKTVFAPVFSRLLNNDVLATLSETGQQLARRFAEVLIVSMHTRERTPLRLWLENIWLALGGARAYERDDSVAGDQKLWQEAEAFFQLLQNKVPYLTDFDQDSFEQALEKLFVKSPNSRDPATVQLMTMHKSKGLEFDSVILPYLHKKPKSDNSPLLFWDRYYPADEHDHSQQSLLLAVNSARGARADAIYDYLKYKRQKRNELEQVRLLYVAATRARFRLYLGYAGKTNDKNDKAERLPPASGSLLARLLPAFEHESLSADWEASWTSAIAAPKTGIAGSASVINNQQNRHVAANTLQRLQPDWREFVYREKLASGEAASWESHAVAIAVGKVVHKVLEIVADKSLDFWNAFTPVQQQALIRRELEPLLPVLHLGEAIKSINKHLANVFSDQKALWILDARHQQSQVESAFFVPDTKADLLQRDEFRQQVIDRTFIDKGCCWLIDYKTAEPKAGESQQEFLLREEKEYLPQQKNYARILQQRYGLPVKAALYFTAIPYFHEINL